MTIASCYISPEGVVFGADSTTTYTLDNGNHYFNHAQKMFEVGENATLGIVTWGLGSLVTESYRTLIAKLADQFTAVPPASVADAATQWIDLFWAAYQGSPAISGSVAEVQRLHGLQPHIPTDPTAAGTRTAYEETLYNNLRNLLVVGFCIGGYVPSNREPMAFEIVIDPLSAKPVPTPVHGHRFWGAPNMINRLLFGCDDNLLGSILSSGKWTGTDVELLAIVQQHAISHPPLPIRDAIDFTHACIMSTIKALKFSSFSQICGGPVEIAVITTDRKFRWVRHKPWDTAITEGEI
ncbi:MULTISPECIES: hypothetical protein [Rhizobium]|uniref:hypothetical protein n=1 Tax=Rhizobium TaxID=379 RepID=UPI00117B6914|nr:MULTISPECIES: hypothetical protein [Rhizobium]MBY3134785.1 hypothetical protein [Rhizobium laguerreae]